MRRRRFHIHWHRHRGNYMGLLMVAPIYECRCGSKRYGSMF
jgi:hypothetical protein